MRVAFHTQVVRRKPELLANCPWPTANLPFQNHGKTLPLSRLGLPLSEKQIPQVVENLESGGKPKEALERAPMRPRQVRMAWEELILATPASLLYRSVGSLHPG